MVEQYSVRIFHHFIPPYILSGTMFGATLEQDDSKFTHKSLRKVLLADKTELRTVDN